MPRSRPAAGPRTLVKVWDLPVRLIHWTVAALVLWDFLDDSGGPAHRTVGYAVVALVVSRIVWGFIGRPPGRLSAWLPAPKAVAVYAAAALRGRPARHLSHNPLGALMILLIWLLIFLLGITGYMSRLDTFWGDEWLQDLHAAFAHGLLACIAIHIAAALVMSFVHRENLIAAMVSGKKRAGDDQDRQRLD